MLGIIHYIFNIKYKVTGEVSYIFTHNETEEHCNNVSYMAE